MKTIQSIIVSAVVALIVSFIAIASIPHPQTTPVTPTPSFVPGAANVNTNIDSWVNGLQIGDEVQREITVKMAPGSNQVFWKNNTGRPVYAYLAQISTVSTTTNATAATTLSGSNYEFFAASTTVATTTAFDFLDPSGYLINGFQYATSSTATTTSSQDFAKAGYKVIAVPDGAYLWGLMKAQDYCPSCKSATSTLRGFNPTFRFFINYVL